MKVYKFGGASVKDADGVKNLASILSKEQDKLLVVVSAMGKTTNKLENILNAYFKKNSPLDLLFEELKQAHYLIADELFENQDSALHDALNNIFVEIEWILEEEPHDDYDFLYDQMVSTGELLSTTIISHYLNKVNIKNHWADARSYIQTDNNYREGKVNWEKTNALINSRLKTILERQIVITQGFIGVTSENFTTTLGREGSDYSAAIFSNCLNAKSLTIWKDVKGVLNADPKIFDNTQKFDEISYHEAIEMTFYGATVIHPKTIKPLQEKNIPLYVKPFLNPDEPGTVIKNTEKQLLTPVFILKQNQVLLSLSTKDYSFISENHLSDIFGMFSSLNIKINLMQNSALSFSACFDDDENRFKKLKSLIEKEYHFKYNDQLSLLTIRHFSDAVLKEHLQDKLVLLEQLSRSTAQIIYK